jgi:transposase
MGRRRTRLDLSEPERAEARRLCRDAGDPRERERARFALEAATGKHTLEELALRLGRSRSTLQNWLVKFAGGGLAGLLEREAAPGVASPLAGGRLERQLRRGLAAGRWRSAADVAAWLEAEHGVRRSRKSIYYWFQKWGTRAPGAEAIAPSENTVSD